MNNTSITLPNIRAAYELWLGKPSSVMRLQQRHPAQHVPSELDILFFQPRAISGLVREADFTFITTAGMSTIAISGPYPRLELILGVDGPQLPERLEALGRALGTLAVVPFLEPVAVAPNTIVCDVRLPLFERMNCVLITHWAVFSERWLSPLHPPVLVLDVIPLFETEAAIIREIGDQEAARRFTSEGINWHDPNREAARLRPMSEDTERIPPVEEPMSKSIRDLWMDIEEWYHDHAPNLVSEFNAGASDQDISRFEQEVGLSLSSDYKESIHIHNGGGIIHGYTYLSLIEVFQNWSLMTQLKEEGAFEHRPLADEGGGILQGTWWDRRWLPIAEHKAGTLICIDLAPGAKGVIGQLIQIETQEEGPFPIPYKSFFEWLRQYRDDLYAGQYQVENGELVARRRL